MIGIRMKTPRSLAAAARPIQLEYEFFDQYYDAIVVDGASASWKLVSSVEGDPTAGAATVSADGVLVMGDTTESITVTITPVGDAVKDVAPIQETITIGREAPKAPGSRS